MKKTIFTITTISLLLVLILSACSSTPEQVSASDTGSANTPKLNDTNENAMPVSTQLMLGTLKLEETELAVDPAQAAELLVLWKAARSLSQSENVAAEEMDAVFKQIQDAMTPEQIDAIVALQLTREDMFQLAEDLGLSFGARAGAFGNLSPEMQATAQAARESGQGFPGGGPGGAFPGGFPGGNPGGGGGFGQISPEQQATLEARRAERGNIGVRFTLILADPLIVLLETRTLE